MNSTNVVTLLVAIACVTILAASQVYLMQNLSEIVQRMEQTSSLVVHAARGLDQLTADARAAVRDLQKSANGFPTASASSTQPPPPSAQVPLAVSLPPLPSSASTGLNTLSTLLHATDFPFPLVIPAFVRPYDPESAGGPPRQRAIPYGVTITTWPHPMPFINEPDWWTRCEDRHDGSSWEYDTFSFLKAAITPNTHYVGFGEWVGPTALFAASLTKHVWSFEPDPVAFASLSANFALNPHLKHARLSNWCFSNQTDILRIQYDGHSASRFQDMVGVEHHPRNPYMNVLCVDLIAFLRTYIVPTLTATREPLVIKIDTEGAEHIILPRLWFELLATWPAPKPSLHLSLHFRHKVVVSQPILAEMLRSYRVVYQDRIDLARRVYPGAAFEDDHAYLFSDVDLVAPK